MTKRVRGGGKTSPGGWASMGARGGGEAEVQWGEKVGEGFWAVRD
jgi:hypothetical protein